MAKRSIKAKYRETVKVNYRQEDDVTNIPPTCTSIKCNEYRTSYDRQIDTSRRKRAVGIQYESKEDIVGFIPKRVARPEYGMIYQHKGMSAIYYDQGSDIKAKQCKTIVTFDTILEILDAGDLLILSNLRKPWTIACQDVSRVFEIEYSTYRILNRLELCECSLTAGNYLLSYTNANCGNAPEARDGYFTTYYLFNKIVLEVITEKFDIQVDENTRTQASLLHDNIPGYDLPTIDFVQTSEDDDEDVSILEEDNPQIYAHLDNVLVHMIDKQKVAIFKSKQDFNRNKEKISEYVKYAENWQVILVICSYTAMACDVLLIVIMIVFFLKYHKTMQMMLASFI